MVKDIIYYSVIVRPINNNANTRRKKTFLSMEKVFFTIHNVPFIRISNTTNHLFVKHFNGGIFYNYFKLRTTKIITIQIELFDLCSKKGIKSVWKCIIITFEA